MKPWVKICGITKAIDAQLAVDLGASALGFIMHAESPRRCDPKIARQIIPTLPATVEAIGVWLTESAHSILPDAAELSFDRIQTYDLSVAAQLLRHGFAPLPAIVATEATPPQVIVEAIHRVKSMGLSRCLLDFSRSPDSSRTGTQSFQCLPMIQKAAAEAGIALILAGGLRPRNVRDILRTHRPYGLDIASGIEASPGVKDHQLMRKFFQEIQECPTTATSASTADNSSPKR